MDKYRIRLRGPGSHRLPETGVTDLKQVAAVDRFSCAEAFPPFLAPFSACLTH